MTTFSETAWQQTARLRLATHDLPFDSELAAGTLGPERFRDYIIQDAIYLGQYSRTLAIAGAKAPDGPTLRAFVQSALEAVSIEQALHERYLAEFGVDPAQIGSAEPSPDCLAYTGFGEAGGELVGDRQGDGHAGEPTPRRVGAQPHA